MSPIRFYLKSMMIISKNWIEKADVIKILQLVESYVFRRSICDVSTAVMNKLFAALMNEVDKNNYLDSLNNAFLAMRTYRRYPTDSEFKEAFINKDVYNFTRRNYLLRKLENYERSREPIEVSGYTIEHVMPQKLTEAWQQELGKDFQRIHEVWLHKIGNLTLTGFTIQSIVILPSRRNGTWIRKDCAIARYT